MTEIARSDIRGSLISFAPAYTSLGKNQFDDNQIFDSIPLRNSFFRNGAGLYQGMGLRLESNCLDVCCLFDSTIYPHNIHTRKCSLANFEG